MKSMGFRILPFPNEVVLDHPEEFLANITALLNLPSTSGRGPRGEGGQMQVLSTRKDIIVLTGEAHRSQYDTLALNMRAALPSATFVAFTGTPLDYQQKFEELISSYNSSSRNIDQLFEELLKLSRELSEVQTRHVRENLGPAELVIFDILTRPAAALSESEREEVKKVAQQLLAKVHSLLGTLWKGTQQGPLQTPGCDQRHVGRRCATRLRQTALRGEGGGRIRTLLRDGGVKGATQAPIS